MTTAEVYLDFKTQLKTIYDNREAENIADWVFENVTGLKRWKRRENQQKDVPQNQFIIINNYLKELLKHKPIQYVLNEAWFYKRKFFVNEHVLIPRPETEELVEWIVDDEKNNDGDNSKQTNIIEIGTGSGCISVALKKELPNAKITAIDVSEKALSVAKKNAANLDSVIEFFRIDFLNESEWHRLSRYDIIVSNPPYIPIKEKEILDKNVTDFEPGIALFVDDNDPFIFYKKIAGFAKKHLKDSGKIFLEMHESYASEVRSIYENSGFIAEIKKDMYGKERMLKATKINT